MACRCAQRTIGTNLSWITPLITILFLVAQQGLAQQDRCYPGLDCPGDVGPTRPRAPDNPPPPATKPREPGARNNPAQAAEQVVRLIFSPSSTVDDLLKLLHVPFCAEKDIILSNAADLRTYLESKNSDNDVGKYIVSVISTEIISQINFQDTSWIFRNYEAKQMIARCAQNDIVSPSDRMVTLCVRMVDLRKEVLADVIVDNQSRLIKLIAFSANRCSV